MREALYAIRRLRRTPGFTIIALLTIALGIGANVAAFNLLNALVLRGLPVPNADQLTTVSLVMRNGTEAALSFPAFQELRDHSGAFESFIAGVWDMVLPVEIDGQLTRNDTYTVSGNFFEELGARPALGRLLQPADVDLASFAHSSVVVLGHRFWQQRLGGNPAVLGRTIRIDGALFTVVGVAPRGFMGLSRTIEPELILPLTARDEAWTQASVLWLNVIGRRRPGVSLAEARAQVESQWPTILRATMPATFAGPRRDNYLSIKPVVGEVATRFDSVTRRSFMEPLLVVLALSLCVLAVASVNLAGLMLARTAVRTHDIGVQLALGAAPWRVGRQIVVEGLIVASAGSIAGVVLAPSIAGAASRLLLSGMITPTIDVHLGARVLLASVILTLVVCATFTAVPAWRVAHGDAINALRRGGGRTTASGRLGRLVVIAQVALTVMLVTNAGLLVRTLTVLRNAPLGVDGSDVMSAMFMTRPGVPPLPPTALRTIVDQVSAIPGVGGATLSRAMPLAGALSDFVGAGRTPDDQVRSEYDFTAPDYFRTMGVALLLGRDFSWSDTAEGRVAIVSQSLARRLFGSRAAVGERVNLGFLPQHQNLEIVGVVSDVRLRDLKNVNPYAVYVPAAQEPALFSSGGVILFKGKSASAAELRPAVAGLGLDVLSGPSSLDALREQALLRERLIAMIAGFFGGLALLLAAIGVYGQTASAVTARTREMGIRLALGATPLRLLAGVMTTGALTALIGIAVGLVPALVSVRLVRSLLFGITPHDVLATAGAPALLVVSAVAACVVPAVRAARVDVMRALRTE